MNKKLALLLERREQLVAKAAVQRSELAQHIVPLCSIFSIADRGLSLIRYVKHHPVLMIGATAVFGILSPTRVGKWLRRGWGALLIARNLSKWIQKS